jgi:hypothetical protein
MKHIQTTSITKQDPEEANFDSRASAVNADLLP